MTAYPCLKVVFIYLLLHPFLVKVSAALWTVRLCGEEDSVVLCFPINSSGWELQLFN